MYGALLAVLLALTACCSAGEYAGVVAFGDSLSDMGNRWLSTNKPDIKFRQTWVAQLAGPKMLNAPGFKPSGIASYYGGTNYAVGGAGTDATAAIASDRNRHQNLTQQISRRYLNPAFNTDGVKPDALHVIVIGANDLMLASIGAEQIASQWANFDKVGVAVAQSVEAQIRTLAEAGVKHVLWGNIFDVAQTPVVVSRSKIGGALAPVYLAAMTKAVSAHNQEMDAAIARLEQAFPALTITKFDLFGKFAELIANPKKYGFTSVATGANDSKTLFSADGLHPTSQAHRLLAEYAFEVLAAKRETTAIPSR